MTHNCRVCGGELNDENWSPSGMKTRNYICRECQKEYKRLHREANKDKAIDFDDRICKECGCELNSENWYPSHQEDGTCVCKECSNERCRLYREENRDEMIAQRRLYREENRDEVNAKQRLYRKNNPEKAKASNLRQSRKNGHLSMSENRECSSYLGVYRAERVLRHLYKDVEVMPYGNPGYDFICNKGKKIDAKSGCIRKNRNGWTFSIKRNTIADYFLCIAFDNRDDLNPLHIWMLPGEKFNHLTGAWIGQSTLRKWAEYEQNIDDAVMCCDEMKTRS